MDKVKYWAEIVAMILMAIIAGITTIAMASGYFLIGLIVRIVCWTGNNLHRLALALLLIVTSGFVGRLGGFW